MAQTYLMLLWHMHQPFYKDLAEGVYTMPWARLHTLKDYYGMVAMLEDLPEARMTFNLVPCLVQQVIEYANEEATSRFLRVCRIPPDRLSDDDKSYILSFFFSINYDKVIARYPRYQVDEDAIEFLHSGNVQGPTSVPVTVG